MGGVLELAVAGERGGEAAFACAHGVALPGDGERGGAGAADVAGDEREVVDDGDGGGALGGVVDAHGPADEGGFGGAVEVGYALDGGFREAGDLGYVGRGEVLDEGGEVVEAFDVGIDVAAVDEAVADEDVGDAVEERDVGAGLNGEVEVGHHGGLGDARIGDDEGAVPVALETLAEDGVIVGHVGADEEDDVGGFEVGVGAGRAVAAKGELVAGDGAGHAEGGVAVVVGGAEAELDELAEGVELLGEELAGADDAEGVGAVLRLDGADAPDHGVDGFLPGDGDKGAVLAEEGCGGTAGGGENVVFGKAFGAELAAVDGVIWVAASCDGFAIAGADEHATADGAVATGGGGPGVGDAGLGDVAEAGVFAIGVLVPGGVEAEHAGEACGEGHAGLVRIKVRPMLRGTTETKKR